MQRAIEKHKWVRAVQSKPKALRHFRVDPVLKIDKICSKADWIYVLTVRVFVTPQISSYFDCIDTRENNNVIKL